MTTLMGQANSLDTKILTATQKHPLYGMTQMLNPKNDPTIAAKIKSAKNQIQQDLTSSPETSKLVQDRKNIQNLLEQNSKYLSANPVSSVLTPPPAPSIPQVGEVVSGYKFKGGNPNDKNNWVKQ